MKRLFALSVAALLLLPAAGCVNYRLGSMLPPDVATVYMPTCVNKTSEPLIEQDVTREILSEIQMDGSLRVAGAVVDMRLGDAACRLCDCSQVAAIATAALTANPRLF